MLNVSQILFHLIPTTIYEECTECRMAGGLSKFPKTTYLVTTPSKAIYLVQSGLEPRSPNSHPYSPLPPLYMMLSL